MIVAASDGGWSGILTLPGQMEYHITAIGNEVVSVTAAQGFSKDATCEQKILPASRAIGANAAMLLYDGATQGDGNGGNVTSGVGPAVTGTLLAAPDQNGFYQVTVLYVMDDAAVATYRGMKHGDNSPLSPPEVDTAIDNDDRARMAACNTVLANSQITNMRWNYQGTFKAPASFVSSGLNNILAQIYTGTSAMGAAVRA